MEQLDLTKFMSGFDKVKHIFKPEYTKIIAQNIEDVYQFRKPVFSFNVNATKSDVGSLLEYLNHYFFVKHDADKPNLVLISHFKHYIDIVPAYEKYIDVLKFFCGNSLQDIYEYCAKYTPPMVKLNRPKVSELDHVLNLYRDNEVFLGNLSFDIVQKEVIGAYKNKKSISSIECYSVPLKDITLLVAQLKPFFFVELINLRILSENSSGWEIFISNFKHFLELGVMRLKQMKSIEKQADLFGLLYGYSLEDIYNYCSERGTLEHLVK